MPLAASMRVSVRRDTDVALSESAHQNVGRGPDSVVDDIESAPAVDGPEFDSRMGGARVPFHIRDQLTQDPEHHRVRGVRHRRVDVHGDFDTGPALRNRQDFLCGFSQSDLLENCRMQDEGQFSEALGDLAQPAWRAFQSHVRRHPGGVTDVLTGGQHRLQRPVV